MEMESPSTCESYVGKDLEDKMYVQTFIAWEIQKRKYKKFGLCQEWKFWLVPTTQGINIGYQCTKKEGYSDRYSD